MDHMRVAFQIVNSLRVMDGAIFDTIVKCGAILSNIGYWITILVLMRIRTSYIP